MSGEQLSADDAWRTAATASGTCSRPDSCASATATGSATPERSGCSSRSPPSRWSSPGRGSAALGVESFAEVVARTVVAPRREAATPWWPTSSRAVRKRGATGASRRRARARHRLRRRDLGVRAAGTGANRIYGTDCDRPALRKYARAAVLTMTAGSAPAVGLLLIVAASRSAMPSSRSTTGATPRSPCSTSSAGPRLAALVFAVTVLFRTPAAPAARVVVARGRGDGHGAAVAGGVRLLGLYVECGQLRRHVRPAHRRDGTVAVGERHRLALLAGVALAAQLEAVRAGGSDLLLTDSDDDGIPDHLDEQPGSPAR